MHSVLLLFINGFKKKGNNKYYINVSGLQSSEKIFFLVYCRDEPYSLFLKPTFHRIKNLSQRRCRCQIFYVSNLFFTVSYIAYQFLFELLQRQNCSSHDYLSHKSPVALYNILNERSLIFFVDKTGNFFRQFATTTWPTCVRINRTGQANCFENNVVGT